MLHYDTLAIPFAVYLSYYPIVHAAIFTLSWRIYDPILRME